MGDSFNYSASKLEQCTYRYLQQLAKSMCLPSNVKKVYLVEMINAKKCASEMEVQRIVQRVKRERQQLRYIKKRNRETLIQADTSSSESTSPPIHLTPKRTPFMLRCSDLRQQIVASQNSLLRSTATKPVSSDRVLRSCNLKTVKRPYMNKYLEVHQTNHIELVDQSTQMTPMRVIKKYKPNILGSSHLSNDRQMAPVTQIGRQIVVRRSRTVSAAAGGGAALVRVRGVRVRDGAGHLAALPAFVRKPRASPATSATPPASSSGPRSSLTLQDIINGNMEAHTARLSCHTSTSTGIREVQTPEYTELTPESSSSVYYHKKIRAEQVRERRMSSFNTSRCPLPRISEAFGQFRAQRHDVTQPLYVHVGGESAAYSTTGAGSCLLETVYNFKRQFLTAPPQAAAAATRCVYSAHTVATAAPHRPAASAYSDPYMASYERDNQYYGDPDNTRGDDYLRFGDEYDFRYHEDQNTSGSSMCTVQSQELGANVTISDMVEDALELISQDGDYLERMGMDVRMQCVLCNWAGPKIILEYHIRKEHANDIDKQEKREWNISYTLGSVVSYPLWQSRVVEHACSLYVLSVKYEPPGYFMATLATSRQLDSTFRYVKFVNKLRALEEEQRKGAVNKLAELKDKQYSDFFIRCDRRSLINNVARRVDLCLASYQDDLEKKRVRLKELLSREEEENIAKFVEQVQAGREAAWQEKQDRLAYLLAKRKKEHEDKYKDTPLSKCAHVSPCLVKQRAMDTQDIQLYQMREKAARREAERELDNMWHELAMKESEALAARMEYDTIERARRDMECHQYSKYQMEQNRINNEKEKEKLKQETLYFRGLWDKAIKDEEEAERGRAIARQQTALERKQAIDDRKKTLAKQEEDEQCIQNTWAGLTGQCLGELEAEEELRRRKERELDECNRKMVELRDAMRASEAAADGLVSEQARRYQQTVDEKRCQYLSWSQKTNREVRKAMIDQIHDRQHARAELKEKLLEQEEYHRQLFQQLERLAAHKDLTDAQQRKKHQHDLLQQIEYNKLLKERALKEEQDQIKKCQRATEEYNEEIRRMLARPFFSDELHPFMKQMAKGLEIKTCPCTKPNYCAPAPSNNQNGA